MSPSFQVLSDCHTYKISLNQNMLKCEYTMSKNKDFEDY